MIITDELLLRKISSNIEKGENIVDDIKQIKEEIALHANGVGLSAPQIGIFKRIVVMRIKDKDDNTPDYIVFRNPVITEKEERVVITGEGCLSYPGQYINTKRYNKIRVVDDNNPKGIGFIGFPAIVLQHEIDHLDGILMYDREYKACAIGRNEKCSCGSGKKFKKCCGVNIQ